MSFAHGSNSSITVDGTDLSTYTDSVSQVGAVATADVTAFGNDDAAFIAGLKSGSWSLAGHFDPTADAALYAMFDGAVVAIIYGPAGTTAGLPKYTANAFVTDYTIGDPVRDKVSWNASFTRDGALTRGTF